VERQPLCALPANAWQALELIDELLQRFGEHGFYGFYGFSGFSGFAGLSGFSGSEVLRFWGSQVLGSQVLGSRFSVPGSVRGSQWSRFAVLSGLGSRFSVVSVRGSGSQIPDPSLLPPNS
jgi:hypothetical protein